jgi:hypothetical protein
VNLPLQEARRAGLAPGGGRSLLAAIALGAALIAAASGAPALALDRAAAASGPPARTLAGPAARRSARPAARGLPSALLSATLSGSIDARRHTLRVDVTHLLLAGGRARISGVLRPGGWSIEAHATAVDLDQVAGIARPWVKLPPGYQLSGHADLEISLTGQRGPVRAQFTARSPDLSLTNQPGTVVAQQVAASISGTLVRHGNRLAIDARAQASAGQALAGPALLDFTANPLTLHTTLQRDGDGPIVLSGLDLEQRNLMQAHAEGIVQPGGHASIVSAHVVIARLELAAAYKSYLQLPLATTELGALQSSGEAAGSIDIAHDAITRLDCSLRNINLTDPQARVLVQQANGDIHWVAVPGATVAPSEIAWQRAAAYNLSGGPVRLRFVTWQRNFALLGGNSRLPVLDGAVIVHTLVGRDLGTPQAKVDFDADVTPISMPRLSKALGWPIMSGDVSAHIPLVRYRNRELTFDGDLIAKVFDGTVTGSQIVLRNPLGPWPSLSADVLARGLDLDLVTHTFAFGSITGRIDVDVHGLQLFDWSPVAFDASLYTMPGDRSPHRVSQNAVTRIAGLGGAAAAVKAALESGVLKFFHTFDYDRIGIGCRLRNEVCEMSGAGSAPDGGYYLIQGDGVPRLDIIGNVRRVDWQRLIGQIGEGMRERDFVVHTGSQ